jgi:hypothetical protein
LDFLILFLFLFSLADVEEGCCPCFFFFFLADCADATKLIDSTSDMGFWDEALAATPGQFNLTRESNDGVTIFGATTADEALLEPRLGFCEVLVTLPA